MNFKKTAIALAMAGVVATPMAVQAEGTAYASARIGLHSLESDGNDQEFSVDNYSSRFGLKGETDLGNGLTSFGRYEFSVSGDADFGGRHQYIGLKGDFGKITLGRTNNTFFNFVVGPNDSPWAGSGYAMLDYVSRESNSVSYAGSAGAFSYGVTLGMVDDDADEDLDRVEYGVSVDIGDMTLALAVYDEDAADDAIVGLALTGIALGDVSLGFGLQSQDDDTSFLFDIGIGPVYIHYEAADLDANTQNHQTNQGGQAPGDETLAADATATTFTVGYTMSLGRKTSAWFEYFVKDFDVDGVEDTTNVRAVLKYDIL